MITFSSVLIIVEAAADNWVLPNQEWLSGSQLGWTSEQYPGGPAEDSFRILVELPLDPPSKRIQEGWLEEYPPIMKSPELELAIQCYIPRCPHLRFLILYLSGLAFLHYFCNFNIFLYILFIRIL
jgi:hypothetical protein